MIPALIFGTVYYFCFAFDRSGMPFLFIVKIFGGVGHLWFLPMLFWCFVATWLLRNYMIDEKILVVLLVVLSLLPLPIPLGIGNMLHYGIYFYMGMLTWNKRGMIIDKWLALKVMLPVGLLYIVSLFAFLNRSSFFIEGNDALVIKGINYMIDNVVRLVVNVSGIFIIYLNVVKFVNGGVKYIIGHTKLM